jgi:hypothetical protein
MEDHRSLRRIHHLEVLGRIDFHRWENNHKNEIRELCTPDIINLPILNLAEIGRPFKIKTSTIRMVQHSCHTCFSKENQVQTYMHARIKFHAYSDIKVHTETVSHKKEKDYQSLHLILETETPNITGIRLGVAYA